MESHPGTLKGVWQGLITQNQKLPNNEGFQHE